MNVTEIFYLSYDLVNQLLLKDFLITFIINQWYSHLIKYSWELALILLDLSLFLAGVLYNFLSKILSLSFFILIICFIRSLNCKYKFCSLNDSEKDSYREIGVTPRSKDLVDDDPAKSNSVFLKIQKSISKVASRLSIEYQNVEDASYLAIDDHDAQSVHKELSWSQTHSNIESVNWLNKTLLTLWPSIKLLLNRFLFDKLLKKKNWMSKQSKQLSKKQAKLSVWISSRRNLELLQKTIKSSLQTRSWKKRIMLALQSVIKMLFIYMKQSVMDYINCFSANKHEAKETIKKFSLGLNAKIKTDNLKKKISQKLNRSKSWTAFHNKSDKQASIINSGKGKNRIRLCRSAPPRLRHGIIFTRPNLRKFDKLREKRLKLVEQLEKNRRKIQDGVIFEKINLGRSMLEVRGIRYLEKSSSMYDEASKVGKHLMPNDTGSMRFIAELSYTSDRRFNITMSSIPVLDRICLTRLNLRIRLLINLNHSTLEMNRNSKILDTPHDILWPIINHAQIALVDVPKIDWMLEKPRSKLVKLWTQGAVLSKYKDFMPYSIKQYFNLVSLINHPYFKYIIHSLLYFGLKWFQPFDIKIGERIYLKSIC